MGKHMTNALLATGKHKITVITRPDSQAEFPAGVDIARVDYSSDDLSALVAALRGQEVLLVTLSVRAPPGTVTKFIRAADEAGVKYILPNWYGQDPTNKDLIDGMGFGPMRDGIFAALEQTTSLKCFFLGCNFWYEFSLAGGVDRFGFDLVKRTYTMLDGGNTKVNTATWPQCGRAVAALLSLKELPDDADDKTTTLAQFANKAVYISSFLLSQNDMFASVKRVTGTTDADWTITHDTAQQRWAGAADKFKTGDYSVFARLMYSRGWFLDGSCDLENSVGLANHLLGLPVEDLDEATKEAVRMGLNHEVAH